MFSMIFTYLILAVPTLSGIIPDTGTSHDKLNKSDSDLQGEKLASNATTSNKPFDDAENSNSTTIQGENGVSGSSSNSTSPNITKTPNIQGVVDNDSSSLPKNEGLPTRPDSINSDPSQLSQTPPPELPSSTNSTVAQKLLKPSAQQSQSLNLTNPLTEFSINKSSNDNEAQITPSVNAEIGSPMQSGNPGILPSIGQAISQTHNQVTNPATSTPSKTSLLKSPLNAVKFNTPDESQLDNNPPQFSENTTPQQNSPPMPSQLTTPSSEAVNLNTEISESSPQLSQHQETPSELASFGAISSQHNTNSIEQFQHSNQQGTELGKTKTTTIADLKTISKSKTCKTIKGPGTIAVVCSESHSTSPGALLGFQSNPSSKDSSEEATPVQRPINSDAHRSESARHPRSKSPSDKSAQSDDDQLFQKIKSSLQ